MLRSYLLNSTILRDPEGSGGAAPVVTPDDDDEVIVAEKPREPTEYERQLRRDLRRARATAKTAETTRETAIADVRRESETALTALRTENGQRLVRAELKAHALAAGIVDLDALRLMDLGTLKLDEQGEVQGAAEAIALFKTSKPHFFGEAKGSTPLSTGSTGHAGNPPRPAPASTFDARTANKDAYAAERARLIGR